MAEKPLAPLHQLFEVGKEGNASQIGLRAWCSVLPVGLGKKLEMRPLLYYVFGSLPKNSGEDPKFRCQPSSAILISQSQFLCCEVRRLF